LQKKEFEYHQTTIDNDKSDIKLLWIRLKGLIVKKKQMRNVQFDGILETDTQKITDKLNFYFIESVIHINNSIPSITNTNCPYMQVYNLNQSMKL